MSRLYIEQQYILYNNILRLGNLRNVRVIVVRGKH